MLTLHHIFWVENPISLTQDNVYVCRVTKDLLVRQKGNMYFRNTVFSYRMLDFVYVIKIKADVYGVLIVWETLY